MELGCELRIRAATMVDMSIPMEQLGSAAERYARILTLQKKPYQLGTGEINKYFKM